MRGLEVDGVFCKGESDISVHVVEFYKKLYQETESWQPIVDGLDFACLDETESLLLEREFDKDETIAVLRESNGDKVLWLNGFTVAFSQKC